MLLAAPYNIDKVSKKCFFHDFHWFYIRNPLKINENPLKIIDIFEKIAILRPKMFHRKKTFFTKNGFFRENSIRATRSAIVHPYNPLGPGGRSLASWQIFRKSASLWSLQREIICNFFVWTDFACPPLRFPARRPPPQNNYEIKVSHKMDPLRKRQRRCWEYALK